MLISLKHKFVFLCMPKCASTSAEASLVKFSEIRIGGHPKLKHTNFEEYVRFVKPMLDEKFGSRIEEIEVVCLFRHPLSWLNSWYRYRSDRSERNTKSSGRDTSYVSFEEFLDKYVSDRRGHANVGRQIDRILDADGKMGNVVLFQYEQYSKFLSYMSNKIGRPLQEKELNVSPAMEMNLSQFTSYLNHPKILPDWTLYQSIGTQVGRLKEGVLPSSKVK